MIRGSIFSARRALGRQIFDKSKWNELQQMLRSAATQAAKELASDPNAHIGAGIRALRRGDNAAAAECFYRAFRLRPSHMGALHGLAEALVADEKYERAIPIYEMIVGLSPEDCVSQFNLGVVLSRLRRFGEAAEVYRRLLEVN